MSKHVGGIFPTNKSGNLEITKYINANSVEVAFCDTGFETVARMTSIRNGSVKDFLRKSVFGVGFVGVGEHKVKLDGKISDSYRCWSGMLGRCYSVSESAGNPTYKDCTVHPDWHNFQTFAKWYHENYPNDGGRYQLDKDILVEGNKIYGPETCMFVSHKANVIKATAKSYTFISPEGDKVEIYNMADFCRSNGLDNSAMCHVHSGKHNSHKGWTK